MDDIDFIRILLVVITFLEDEDNEEEQQRAIQRRRWRRTVAILCHNLFGHQATQGTYCELNRSVPVLRRFFEGGETKTDFRLNRPSIVALLHLMDQTRHHGWGPTVETLFLFWLASGASYRVVSCAFDIPKSTVFDIIHRVATVLCNLTAAVIRLPSTPEEQTEIGEGFARLAGHQVFRGAIGAIDGCHIRIKTPAEPDAQCYRNRKLFHSIQLQAVCDHRGRFIDVFIGYPGSVHDARILRNSPLYYCGTYPPPATFLLGDGGYPCLERPICLMTPYKQPVRGALQQRFNTHHSRARSVIERAFGVMKTRWRAIFFSALEVDPTFVPDVILTCTILHNLCIANGDIIPVDEEDGDDGDDEERGGGETASGIALRNTLAEQLI